MIAISFAVNSFSSVGLDDGYKGVVISSLFNPVLLTRTKSVIPQVANCSFIKSTKANSEPATSSASATVAAFAERMTAVSNNSSTV